jgi:hypothetical protein
MQVTCPGCNKKLKVPESAAGKKVRCPGCKGVVAVPAPADAPVHRESPAATDPAPQASTMRCAACQAAALQALPPNQWSRHPGYSCSRCQAVMRPPGSTGTYVLVTALGVFVFLVGIVLCVVAVTAASGQGNLASAAAAALALGAGAAGWAIKQLRLPLPLDAPARPSRLGLWLALFLVGLLAAGGVLFCFAYWLHEM